MQDWWPKLDEGDTAKPTAAKRYAGLFVRGQQKRRRKNALLAAKVKAAAKAKAKKEKAKNKKKTVTLKKTKVPEHIPEVLGNYRRQGAGIALVRQQMAKAKQLDDTKFAPNLLFSMEGNLCRMTVDKCKDVPWDAVLAAGHDYFKATYLESSLKQYMIL